LKDFVELIDKSDADRYLQNFLKHPSLRSHAKAYHVLVDEAQDLNSLNYAFLTYLAKTLYAVGDFRQAIYQFRGACPELFQDFKTVLEQQTGTTLDMFEAPAPVVHSILTTFRNSTAVNALANAVAYQLDPSASFTASLDSAAPGHVFIQITTDEETEYQATKSYFLEASRSETLPNAVLARTQAQLNYIQRRFALEDLPALQGIEFKTIHAAKGLEYHNVAIACGSRSDKEDSADFPNLAYVAITRAENDLFLTSQGAFPQIIENALTHCKAFQNLPAPMATAPDAN